MHPFNPRHAAHYKRLCQRKTGCAVRRSPPLAAASSAVPGAQPCWRFASGCKSAEALGHSGGVILFRRQTGWTLLAFTLIFWANTCKLVAARVSAALCHPCLRSACGEMSSGQKHGVRVTKIWTRLLALWDRCSGPICKMETVTGCFSLCVPRQ